MSLRPCPQCEHAVAPDARICPSCGTRLSYNIPTQVGIEVGQTLLMMLGGFVLLIVGIIVWVLFGTLGPIGITILSAFLALVAGFILLVLWAVIEERKKGGL